MTDQDNVTVDAMWFDPTKPLRPSLKSPDQDSAAVEKSIGDVIQDCMDKGYYPWQIARAVLAHLREHPEHGPWPVMTGRKLWDDYMANGKEYDSMYHHTDKMGVILVIPDSPAAEPVPSVEDVMHGMFGNGYKMVLDMFTNNGLQITRLVEAAQGRADDGA